MNANTTELVRNANTEVAEVINWVRRLHGETGSPYGNETRAHRDELKANLIRLSNAQMFLRAALRDRDA